MQEKGQGFSGLKISKLKEVFGEDNLIKNYGKKCQKKYQPWVLSSEEFENLPTKSKYDQDDELVKTILNYKNEKYHLICPRMINVETNQEIDDEKMIDEIKKGKDASRYVEVPKETRFPTFEIQNDKIKTCCASIRPSEKEERKEKKKRKIELRSVEEEEKEFEYENEYEKTKKQKQYIMKNLKALDVNEIGSLEKTKWNLFFSFDRFQVMKCENILDCFMHKQNSSEKSMFWIKMKELLSLSDFLSLTHGNIINIMKDLELTMQMNLDRQTFEKIFVINSKQLEKEKQRLRLKEDFCLMKLDIQKNNSDKLTKRKYEKTMLIWISCLCQFKNMFDESIFPQINSYLFSSELILDILHLCYPSKNIYLVKETSDNVFDFSFVGMEKTKEKNKISIKSHRRKRNEEILSSESENEDETDDEEEEYDENYEANNIVILMEKKSLMKDDRKIEEDEKENYDNRIMENKEDYNYYLLLSPLKIEKEKRKNFKIIQELFSEAIQNTKVANLSFFSLLSAIQKLQKNKKWNANLILNSQAKVIGVKLNEMIATKERMKSLMIPMTPTNILLSKKLMKGITSIILSFDVKNLQTNLREYFQVFNDNRYIDQSRKEIIQNIQSIRYSKQKPYLLRVFSSQHLLFLKNEESNHGFIIEEEEKLGLVWPKDENKINDYINDFELLFILYEDLLKKNYKNEDKEEKEEKEDEFRYMFQAEKELENLEENQSHFNDMQKLMKSVFENIRQEYKSSNKIRINRRIKEQYGLIKQYEKYFGKHELDVMKVNKEIEDMLFIYIKIGNHPWNFPSLDKIINMEEKIGIPQQEINSFFYKIAFQIVHQPNMKSFYFSPFVTVPSEKLNFELSLNYFSNLNANEIVFSFSDLDFVYENVTYLNSSFFSFHESQIPDYNKTDSLVNKDIESEIDSEESSSDSEIDSELDSD